MSGNLPRLRRPRLTSNRGHRRSLINVSQCVSATRRTLEPTDGRPIGHRAEVLVQRLVDVLTQKMD